MSDYSGIKEKVEALIESIGTLSRSRRERAFHEACTPQIVRGLIAENERLNTECKQLILLEHNGGTVEAATNLLAERDKLRAEVASLRTGYEACERVNTELKAEIESLRKERDARHPFKPFHEPSIGYTGCVICGAYTDHGGLRCPKTRATADAGLRQGEQS